jgi:hypothetical protein
MECDHFCFKNNVSLEFIRLTVWHPKSIFNQVMDGGSILGRIAFALAEYGNIGLPRSVKFKVYLRSFPIILDLGPEKL